MALFYYRRVGHHSEITSMIRWINTITFEGLSVITAIWLLHSFSSCNFPQKSAFQDCHTFSSAKFFHSSKWKSIFFWIQERFHWHFIFRSRTFLCGIATANQYVLASIATKTYYDIEMWLSLPGAILFYGVISLIGYFFRMNFSSIHLIAF